MIKSAGLAWAYLRAHPLQTIAITLGLTLSLSLPLGTWLVGEGLDAAVMARSRSTPIVIGAKGDTFDLTLGALYFQGAPGELLEAGLAQELLDYGAVASLRLGHSAGGAPLVGVSPGYFEMRHLQPKEGRLPALLGEAILGGALAKERDLGPGDAITSDVANPYNLAGAYPYRLPIVGVLPEAGTPDDWAVFVDLKTTWLLDGHLHGHSPEDAASSDGDGTSSAPPSAGLFYQSVPGGDDLLVHFHGEWDTLPVSAILVEPKSAKDRDILLGRFALDPLKDAIRPPEVMGRLMSLVLGLRTGLVALLLGVGAVTVGLIGLIMALSWRLRRREIALMVRIGASPLTIAQIMAMEGAFYLIGALSLSLLGFILVVSAFDLMELVR